MNDLVLLFSTSKREAIRRQFRPEKVRLLFVGESPPASGRFFYQRNSGLYRAMRDAFRSIHPHITDENFLTEFQRLGCYLIDLCATPVDKLDPASRRAACAAATPFLSRRIRQLQPQSIVSLVRSISAVVEQAATRVDWRGPMIHVPYPGRWSGHRQVFLATMLPHISNLLRE